MQRQTTNLTKKLSKKGQLTVNLSAHGWIHDSKGKAKSVVFTPEGAAYARLLVEQFFSSRKEPVDRSLPPERP